jgi:hypothetical protein
VNAAPPVARRSTRCARRSGVSASAGCCDRAQLEGTYPGLVTFDASGREGTSLLAAFPAEARASSLFIVDPRGYLMERYDLRAPPKGLLEDLKHLLQLSSIG